MRRPLAIIVLSASLVTCGSDNGMGPGPLPSGAAPVQALTAAPVLVAPLAGSSVSTDSPTLTVRNAAGFTAAQGAQYTFEVFAPTSRIEIARTTVPAGASTTSATLTLPRGMNLAVRVVARSAGGEVAMAPERFGTAAVECAARVDGYARAVVEARIPVCRSMPNFYADPRAALGPPDAVALGGKDRYAGIVSLGDRGYVTVDMEACAADGTGVDLRVHQAVGSEPVTVYAGGSPAGPFFEVGFRIPCGIRLNGAATNRYCEFDLARADIREARYFKIEDGEHYPCAQAGTNTEGADLDAVEILQFRAAGSAGRQPGS